MPYVNQVKCYHTKVKNKSHCSPHTRKMVDTQRAVEEQRVCVATCAAPTNIAVVKYWGKDDEALNTPLNSSVSVTLHEDQLRAKTTVASAPWFKTTRLWLNGKEQTINKRVATVVREMKRVARDPARWANAELHIVSENSFPTAAGLASSAAGYACLVAALAELFDAQEEFPGQLSTIARQGSGSACRSLAGGFVRWERGSGDPSVGGIDSRAVQVCDERHWPELCAIICVVNDRAKDTSSTSGMQTSKRTSALLAYRAERGTITTAMDNIVPPALQWTDTHSLCVYRPTVVDTRLSAIEQAYRAKDFATFGTLTMQDSNQFHATCLDTYPPIFYLNDVSRQIVHLVHAYNAHAGRVQAAYTFDAGPNAVIFLEQRHVQDVLSLLLAAFPTTANVPMPITSGPSVRRDVPVDPALAAAAKLPLNVSPDSIKMLYVSTVGGGARVLKQDEALVNLTTGEPILSMTTTESATTHPACVWEQLAHKYTWLPYAAVAACTTAVVAALAARR